MKIEKPIHFETFGVPEGPVFLWAHGWGQDRASLMPLAKSFEKDGLHILADLPGFGQSPQPPYPCGTAEYADALAVLIGQLSDKPVIWAGHSFGCRVGLQLAARHPGLVRGLFLIAAAGLPRRRPIYKQFALKARITLYKALKALIPLGLSEDWVKAKFGSADYRNVSGIMRAVFVKVVNEDLHDIAASVSCPVRLIYGEEDRETPPEIGERLEKLIPKARLVRFEGYDHYTILSQGRHQVTAQLKDFMKDIAKS